MPKAEALKTAPKRQPTLTDAAHLAGVSPMTVSRVVNGHAYVSASVRRKVERILNRLEYSPNNPARSLKGKRSNVVGVLLPELANPFSVELARGIEDSLSTHGYYSFVISGGGAGESRERSAIQAFSDHRVAGVILAARLSRGAAPAGAEANVAHLAKNRFPVVAIGPEFAEARVDHVTAAYRDGGRMATEHLIRNGRHRIAFIGGSPGSPGPPLRFQGYLDALKEHGIGADEQLISGPSHTAAWCSAEDGYLAMKRLLALPCPPDAVFASNDYAAIGALRAMHEHGVRVPDDIAIAGFDNVSISSITSPALTTVDQFVFAQGKAAGRLLLERIESAAPRRRAIEETFPCELVIRQSSAVQARVAA